MKRTTLERRLGVGLPSPEMLEQALSHPSYINEPRVAGVSRTSYQRLEFLGDAMLGLVVSQELYVRCPGRPEGELTTLRSSLVRGGTLARVARQLDLGTELRLGKGEESTGGRDRDSNLAAAYEAVVGAVLLDRGFAAARRFVLKTMAQELEAVLGAGLVVDDKSRLQEVLQGTGRAPPEYRVVESTGPDHARSFVIQVIIDGQVLGQGRGSRRLEAEKLAAREALAHLELCVLGPAGAPPV